MSDPDRGPPDAFELVHAFVTASLQGELTAGEVEDFEALLRDDAELRRVYAHYLELTAQIPRMLAAGAANKGQGEPGKRRAGSAPLPAGASPAAAAPARLPMPSPASATRNVLGRLRSFVGHHAAVSSLAAALMVLGTLGTLIAWKTDVGRPHPQASEPLGQVQRGAVDRVQRSPGARDAGMPALAASPEEPLLRGDVALLVEAVEPDWAEARAPAIGDVLPRGSFRLRSGLVQLQFLSGVMVIIEGPAELELVSEMEALVRVGRVKARVPPAARGFLLAAADWRIVDQGTEFALDVGRGGEVEVHVLQGKVEVSRAAELQSKTALTTGQAARLASNGQITPMSAATQRFVGEGDVTEQVKARQAERLAAWRRASDELAKDPALVLYYDFESVDRPSGLVRNRAPGALPGSHGTLVGAQWAEGRWPGKTAVEFRQAGNLIHCLPGRKLPAATFVSWICADVLNSGQNAIIMNPHISNGQYYWVLRWGHSLSFMKRRPDRKAFDWFDARNAFSADFAGHWSQVAVVYDSAKAQVRHYLNGQRVAKNDCLETNPVNVERCVIGNWAFSKWPGNFVGRIDELAIFARVLDDQEIARLYEAGKP